MIAQQSDGIVPVMYVCNVLNIRMVSHRQLPLLILHAPLVILPAYCDRKYISVLASRLAKKGLSHSPSVVWIGVLKGKRRSVRVH